MRFTNELARKFNKNYKWIARNRNNTLVVFEKKPHKSDRKWISDYGDSLELVTTDCAHNVNWNNDEPTPLADIRYSDSYIFGAWYLKSVIKPIVDKIKEIEKVKCDGNYECIRIVLDNGDVMSMPKFEAGSDYAKVFEDIVGKQVRR